MTVVATAGHVDHGKSTLVRALTGVEPDRWAEEQRRGLTIDLGFATTVLPSGAELELVDVPGHERFLANMLAGVGAVDACLFVVDACEGWRAQSEEHLRILDGLGLHAGVLALTRAAGLDDTARRSTEEAVRGHAAGTFLAEAELVAVDAPAGIGTGQLVAALDRLVTSLPAPADRARARLWVDRSFTIAGAGTVVTGTSAGGRLRVGDRVEVHPGGQPARIRGLRRGRRDVDEVDPGHRVAINLLGVTVDQAPRGAAVVHPGRWHLTQEVDATLAVLDGSGPGVGARGAHVVHLGSGHSAATIRIIGGGRIGAGSTGLARLRLPRHLPLRPGDPLVLRDAGRGETVATGEVLGVDPVLPVSRARPDRGLAGVVAERGAVDAEELGRLAGHDVAATHGRWVLDAAHADARCRRLRAGLVAGAIPLAGLDEVDRELVARLPGVSIRGGVARAAGAVEDDARALAEAIATMGRLLADHPDGVRIAQARNAWGIHRREAVALVEWMDTQGLTLRRGDLRVPGPRLNTRSVTPGGSPSNHEG